MRKPLDSFRKINNYQLEFYISDIGVSYINDLCFQNRAGNVILARPGDIRRSLGHFTCYCVHFECRNPLFEKEYMYNLPRFTYIPVLRKSFESIVDPPISSANAKALFTNGVILQIFSRIIESNSDVASVDKAKYTDEVIKCIEYIKLHFSENINIEMLYKSIFMGKTTFFKYFKYITNKTPNQYINEIRLTHARNLLFDSSISLTEVAQQCGFSSQAYFNYIFKKFTGISPSQYRKKIIWLTEKNKEWVEQDNQNLNN